MMKERETEKDKHGIYERLQRRHFMKLNGSPGCQSF